MLKANKEKIVAISKAIQKANTISLYCHINPDGDTLGSALAVYTALTQKGKKVDVYCDGVISNKYKALVNSSAVKYPEKIVHDLSIAIDCDCIGRLGNCMKSFLSSKEQIAIDHHKSHEKFAELTLVVPDAAACAEVVFELLDYMKVIDDTVASLLFAGIVTDTGCFQFSSTTEYTHEIAQALMKYNFNASEIIYLFFKRTSPEIFNLKNRVLSKCKFREDGKIAFITFFQKDFDETNTTTNDTEGIIVGAIDVDTVEVAYAISESGDKNWKISIRTKNYVDASDIAREFGGGGHVRAAGCRLNGYYEDVLDKLTKVAKDRL